MVMFEVSLAGEWFHRVSLPERATGWNTQAYGHVARRFDACPPARFQPGC
jgi:hypothetical protein